MYSSHGVPVTRTLPSSKLTIFQEVNLSSFSTVCRGLPCVSAVWGSCPGSVPALGDEAACAAAHLSNGSSYPWTAGSILSEPGLCPHHLLQPNLHSLRPARSKSTKPELQSENEAPAQELPGRVQELAQGWLLTGLVKLWGVDKHHWHVSITNGSIQIETSQIIQTPAPEEYLKAAPVPAMALDWAVCFT